MGNGFCVRCGAALNAGDRFCTQCGAPIDDASHAAAAQKKPPHAASFIAARQAGVETTQRGHVASQQREATCSACQKPLEKDARFCIFCGTAVADTVANAVTATAPEGTPSESSWHSRAVEPMMAAAQNAEREDHYVAGSSFGVGSPYLVDDDSDDEGTTLLNEEQEPPFDIDEKTTVLAPADPRAWLCREATGERYEVECPAVIGKGSAATCRIVGNGAISRKHAKVTLVDGVFYLEDLGSTNKTKVNHEELTPGENVELASGDVIELADEVFVLEVEDGA